MPIKWSIREAKFPADLQAVQTLMREYQTAMNAETCFDAFEEELRDLPGPYARPTGVVVLGFVNREPAACVAMRPLSASTCELKRLYVRPEARGTGLGLGLVRRVLREAREMGYATIKLDTLPTMTQAIKLYEKMGFVRTRPYNHRKAGEAVFFERSI